MQVYIYETRSNDYWQALLNGVLITRLKTFPTGADVKIDSWEMQPALKVCVTTGLSKREVEKAGTLIRHAITKVMSRKV